jgi:hypothetical protein
VLDLNRLTPGAVTEATVVGRPERRFRISGTRCGCCPPPPSRPT